MLYSLHMLAVIITIYTFINLLLVDRNFSNNASLVSRGKPL